MFSFLYKYTFFEFTVFQSSSTADTSSPHSFCVEIQMISRACVQLLGWSINYGYRVRVVPFRWDSTRRRIVASDCKWHYRSYKLAFFVFLTHQLFLTLRCIEFLLLNPDDKIKFDLMESMTLVVYALSFSTAFAVQFHCYHNHRQIQLFVNNYIEYSQRIQG